MTTIVAGTFADRAGADKAGADKAIEALVVAGVGAERINSSAPGDAVTPKEVEVSSGALKGAAIGGAIGLGAGAIAGPAGMVGGAAVGAYVGSLAGAFNGMSEEAAEPEDVTVTRAAPGVEVEVETSLVTERVLAATVLRNAGARNVKET